MSKLTTTTKRFNNTLNLLSMIHWEGHIPITFYILDKMHNIWIQSWGNTRKAHIRQYSTTKVTSTLRKCQCHKRQTEELSYIGQCRILNWILNLKSTKFWMKSEQQFMVLSIPWLIMVFIYNNKFIIIYCQLSIN